MRSQQSLRGRHGVLDKDDSVKRIAGRNHGLSAVEPAVRIAGQWRFGSSGAGGVGGGEEYWMIEIAVLLRSRHCARHIV